MFVVVFCLFVFVFWKAGRGGGEVQHDYMFDFGYISEMAFVIFYIEYIIITRARKRAG